MPTPLPLWKKKIIILYVFKKKGGEMPPACACIFMLEHNFFNDPATLVCQVFKCN